MWKVVATQQGFHNQIFREVGEVFDLLTYPDGTYPPLIEYIPKKAKDGKIIEDEYDEKILSTRKLNAKDEKDLEPAHRDFAEDKGNIAIKKGPKKGEVMRFGWMRRVPDSTPIGLYPLGPNGELPMFWDNVQLPPPFVRTFIAEDTRRPHARINHGKFLDKEVDEAA